MPLVWAMSWRTVIGSAQSGSCGKWRRGLSSSESLPSSTRSMTASTQKCLLVEPIRIRIVGDKATGSSTLAMPKPRR